MSEQDGVQATTLPRPPANGDKEAWKAYWKAQGQPWRTEPEIDTERQKYLAERRSITPDIEQGIYPFKNIKLNRADVEWLLATHERGRGPVDWNDESQRKREGLDLRGANVSREDLSGLPLACMQGGLKREDLNGATAQQRDMAAVCMEKVDLLGVQLQEANLLGAQLRKANLRGAQMEKANLLGAQLKIVNLIGAQLQESNLTGARLQEVDLTGAQLQGAYLWGAQLDSVYLGEAILSDKKHGSILLADVKWGEINLAVIDWTPVKRLGDERRAHQTKAVDDYRAAVRANRQLAVVLRDQGLNEEADHFAYRSQLLQRRVWRLQRRPLKLLLSWFLYLLAGYGYRPLRSLIAYLVIIFGFMGLYLLNAHFVAPHLRWDEALVLSISSFHGRGFFTQNVTLGDTYARLAAIEAIVGLFIEISFIATFTQRFFSR